MTLQNSGTATWYRESSGKQFVDSPTVHIHDLESPALMFKELADFGQVSEVEERKARNRPKIPISGLHADSQPIKGGLRRHHAVEKERAVAAFDDVGFFVLHVRQVARNGLEQIGLGDDALQLALAR